MIVIAIVQHKDSFLVSRQKDSHIHNFFEIDYSTASLFDLWNV